MSLVTQLFNGVTMGALLFLVASGFTLTFGLMRVVNLAHGALYLLGGYIGLTVLRATGSFVLGALVGGVAIAVVGLLSERWLLRRLQGNELAQILLTVGMAYAIGDLCLAIWGGMPMRVAPPEVLTGATNLFGDFHYPTYRLFLAGLGGVFALGLWLLLEKTPIGMAIRAGVDDPEMVGAQGIRITVLFVVVFTLGAFLAGMTGVVGGGFLTLYPHADWDVLVLVLVVVIVGGLGSLKGAFVGSLIVGIIDAVGRWLFPELAYFMIFLPMAIVLMVRPHGLFGREH